MNDKPKTVAEQLDAAENGQEFAAVLQGLFGALEKAIDDPKVLDDAGN